jgi:hypothetical protein
VQVIGPLVARQVDRPGHQPLAQAAAPVGRVDHQLGGQSAGATRRADVVRVAVGRPDQLLALPQQQRRAAVVAADQAQPLVLAERTEAVGRARRLGQTVDFGLVLACQALDGIQAQLRLVRLAGLNPGADGDDAWARPGPRVARCGAAERRLRPWWAGHTAAGCMISAERAYRQPE